MEEKPLVSVVVLNWHGTEDTLKCIDSLRSTVYKNIELILVDNEFSADSRKKLSSVEFFAPVTYIANEKNLGFTGGQLSGLAVSKGAYILLLNNDAALEDRAISKAVETMQSDSKIAVVGGRSYALDEDWNKHGSHFYSHQRVDPITAEVVTYEKDDNEPQEVSNISGACVLIRRSAIDEVGYFDDSFFAYYEETDLFSRFRRNGWKVFFNPEIIVWHKHGASTKNKKYMFHYYMLRNQERFAYKNFDKRSLRLFRKVHARNFRRSLKVYLKNIGRVSKHDAIHKARVIATLNNKLDFYALWRARRTVQRNNPNFSINEVLFEDNPLPASILVDATKITKLQQKNLYHNLLHLTSQGISPAEIIVVSRQPIELPETKALIRIENVVDRQIFDMTALDFFMMSSNFDSLLFATEALYAQKLQANEFSLISKSLRDIYESMASEELAGVVSNNGASRFGRSDFINGTFGIIGLRKTFLVHYLVDNTDVVSINQNVITDVLGESLAQCRKIKPVNNLGHFFGIARGKANTDKYPIINRSLQWNIKKLLIHLHVLIFIVFGMALMRRLLLRNARGTANTTAVTDVTKLSYDNSYPVIINTRDRFDPLMQLVAWLESEGHARIMFVDNDSTYPPLVDYFDACPYQVVRLGRNGMHKAPWESFGVRFAAKDSPYVVSDPDIIPTDECPKNALAYFTELLNKYPVVNKVGFGLRIDDIPDSFAHKEHVVKWESRFWDQDRLLEPGVYDADIDTTLALYRPHTWWFLGPSIRTGKPYLASHEPWYQDFDNPTDDFIFYTTRANNNVSTWSFKKLPKHHLRALKKEGYMPEFIDEEEDDHVKKNK